MAVSDLARATARALGPTVMLLDSLEFDWREYGGEGGIEVAHFRHRFNKRKHAYVTQGLSGHDFGAHPRRENVVIASEPTLSLAGLLSGVALGQVDAGHPAEPDEVRPLAQPWCEGSRMTYAYVALPFFMNLKRMTMRVPDIGAVQLIWMMGVHADEAEMIERDGAPAFDELFSRSGRDPADPFRDSIVP